MSLGDWLNIASLGLALPSAIIGIKFLLNEMRKPRETSGSDSDTKASSEKENPNGN